MTATRPSDSVESPLRQRAQGGPVGRARARFRGGGALLSRGVRPSPAAAPRAGGTPPVLRPLPLSPLRPRGRRRCSRRGRAREEPCAEAAADGAAVQPVSRSRTEPSREQRRRGRSSSRSRPPWRGSQRRRTRGRPAAWTPGRTTSSTPSGSSSSCSGSTRRRRRSNIEELVESARVVPAALRLVYGDAAAAWTRRVRRAGVTEAVGGAGGRDGGGRMAGGRAIF